MALTCFPDTTVLINFGLINRLDILESVLRSREWCVIVSEECRDQYERHDIAHLYPEACGIFGAPTYPTADQARRTFHVQRLMLSPADHPGAHMGEAETIAIVTTPERSEQVIFVTDDGGATDQAHAHGLLVLNTLRLFQLAHRQGILTLADAWTHLRKLKGERGIWPPAVTFHGAASYTEFREWLTI